MTSVPAAASGRPVGGSGRASLEPSLLSAALAYAERGWAVLPLAPSAKRPRYKACEGGPPRHKPGAGGCAGGDGHGVHDATTDPATIRRWWAETPNANIGLATGPLSGGLIVLDVDRRNDGPRSRAALESSKDGGPLPSTLAASTPGGYHLFYRHAGGRLSNRQLARGIDVRTDGGYVVAAPSRHPLGALYEWEADPAPVAELPTWVAERQAHRDDVAPRPRTRPAGAPATEYDPADAVPSTELPDTASRALYVLRGSRHGAVRSAALSMLRHGHTEEQVGGTILASPLEAKVREQGPEWLAEEIAAAAAEIAATEPRTAAHFLEEVAAHVAAADEAVDVWAGRTGRSLRTVLAGFQTVARERGGGTFTASMRDVADACALSRSVVSERWPELVRTGWLEQVNDGDTSRTASGAGVAGRWRLTLPSGRRYTPATVDQADDGIRADHPALRREALGAAGDTFRMLHDHGPKTIRELAALLGGSPNMAGDHVRKLEGLDLVERGGRGQPVRLVEGWSEILDELAVRTGAADAQQEAAARHTVERGQWEEYLAEAAPRHCRSCGQRLSPREGCPSCDDEDEPTG